MPLAISSKFQEIHSQLFKSLSKKSFPPFSDWKKNIFLFFFYSLSFSSLEIFLLETCLKANQIETVFKILILFPTFPDYYFYWSKFIWLFWIPCLKAVSVTLKKNKKKMFIGLKKFILHFSCAFLFITLFLRISVREQARRGEDAIRWESLYLSQSLRSGMFVLIFSSTLFFQINWTMETSLFTFFHSLRWKNVH